MPNKRFKCKCEGLSNKPVEYTISFEDFLLCSIDLTEHGNCHDGEGGHNHDGEGSHKEDPFMLYMREAYNIFFNNADQCIGKCEFLNLLKDDKYVSIKSLKRFINKLDEDKSLSISSLEFFTFMIKTLKIERGGKLLTAKKVDDFLRKSGFIHV